MKRILIAFLILGLLFFNACKKHDEGQSSQIDDQKFDVNTDEVFKTQRENFGEKINSYDEFIAENYPVVFNQKIEMGSFVYSPYSYKMALEGLGKMTHQFSDDNYFAFATAENLKKGISNLESENAIILNKDFFETVSDDFSVVSFPKEAEKISINLQKKILGHTLLEPNYSQDLASVIINATKFQGEWYDEFDKYFTEKRKFTNIMGEVDERDTMWDEISSIAIDNEEVSIGTKHLKDGGQVYFISPKQYDLDSLQKLSAKIPEYIKTFYEFEREFIENDLVKIYDAVELYVPKFNISSEIDLLKVEGNLGHDNISDGFDVVDEIKNKTGQKINIGSIVQVANMMIDEKEVRAGAVTEMKTEATAAPTPEDILVINCDRPFFAVTASDGVISFIAFIGK